MNSGQTSFSVKSTGVNMTGPYSLTVNGNITDGSITSSGPTVLNGAVTGAGIANLLNLYFPKTSTDLQYALKTDVALLQSVVHGSTTQTNYYDLNTGISGLYVRNGTNLIAQFATDGTTHIYNNVNIAGSIAGYALTQINSLVYNAITTLQNNIILNNVTTIGTSIMQAGLSVIGTLAITRNFTVSGPVSMPGYLFCAGMVSAAGVKITSTGQVGYTSSMSTAGIFTITFTSAHPLGANYIVSVTGQGGVALVRGATTTSTSFGVVTYTPATNSSISYIFHFMVLASEYIFIILIYINKECNYNKK